MSYIVDPLEQRIFIIRVCEQAELYDEMYQEIEPIVHDKAASLTPDERLLLSVAAKNYIS